MADPERPGDSVSVWKGVLIVVVALNLGVIAWAVRLTVRILNAPVAREAASDPASAAPGTGLPGGGMAENPALVRTNSTAWSAAEAPAARSDRETAQHLMEQDSVLRRELRENAGNDSGLTPTKEEVDRLMKDGRMVF